MSEVTLGILSRGRPEVVQEAITTAFENSTLGERLRVMVVFDDDYKSAYSTIAELSQKYPFDIYTLSPRHYYVRGANAFLNLCQTERFIFSNDDVLFYEGWDEKAMAALDKVGGIVELGDEPFKCAHFITTKAHLVKCNNGFIGNPMYTFYFSDRELMMRSIANKEYHWLNPGVLCHQVLEDNVRSEVEYWGPQDRALWGIRCHMFGFTEEHGDEADYEVVL